MTHLQRFWLWLAKHCGGLWDIGRTTILLHDRGLTICRDRVVKWEFRT
jgi:hypothetical protein